MENKDKIIAELKAENDRLHEKILKLTEESGSLIVQNNTLKENFDGQRNAYKKLNSQYIENCEYTGKLEQTLQEIKAIANTRFVNGLNEEADIYNADMDRILDLITKAESEG